MKASRLLITLVSVFLTVGIATAAPSHQPPQHAKIMAKSANMECGLPVINNNDYPVAVYGTYDDGSIMNSFVLGPYGDTVFIPLFNRVYNVCDLGINLRITDVNCSPNNPGCIIVNAYAYQGRPFYVPVDPYAARNKK